MKESEWDSLFAEYAVEGVIRMSLFRGRIREGPHFFRQKICW